MKNNLVKESISFQRGIDPREILGIGTLKIGEDIPEEFRNKLYWCSNWVIEEPFSKGTPEIFDYLRYYGTKTIKGRKCYIFAMSELMFKKDYIYYAYPTLVKESYDEDDYENDLSLHEDPLYDEVYYALRDLGISDEVADDLVEKNAELIHEAEDQNFTILEIAYMLKDRIK